jgi:hypothetical protein
MQQMHVLGHISKHASAASVTPTIVIPMRSEESKSFKTILIYYELYRIRNSYSVETFKFSIFEQNN